MSGEQLRLFVTGVGTGVGKTVLSGLLAKMFLGQGRTVRYLKPVQTGHPPDDDAAEVRRISGLPADRAALLYTAEEPVAPCFAFDPFPFDDVVAAVESARDADVLLVEGAGGLLVPLDHKRTFADLVRATGLEIVLAIPNRLGCINDTALNLYFIEKEGLPLHGLAMNEHFENDAKNRERNTRAIAAMRPGAALYAYDAGIRRL
ncbi:MAG: dethiobiotin synthase [Thermodesulfobacteriota bacterium]